ncbi:hypothetical protein B0G83_104391 [Paraburkholderia sp. BL21I4N1]|nr:hypothetical protein B0G83_104391 [Paraburkholderia sp. BL21I4N1]
MDAYAERRTNRFRPSGLQYTMDYRVSYEHSLKSEPEAFIAQVSSQLVGGVPGNIPRALLPEYITELILRRSPTIGRIRHLRVL